MSKEERINAKSRNGYYITILVNGEEFKMNVNKLVYSNYQIDDKILLYKYEGALGYSYYEYQMESIYIYNNK